MNVSDLSIPARRTRVLLVDDSADIRDLYRRLIEKSDDLQCVESLDSTADLEAAVERSGADVAIVDLIGTGRDPVEAVRSTVSKHPACRIIVFSGHDDEMTRREILQAGATSLVSKYGDVGALLEEIRRVRDQ